MRIRGFSGVHPEWEWGVWMAAGFQCGTGLGENVDVLKGERKPS